MEEFLNVSEAYEQKLIDEKAQRIWEYAFACAILQKIDDYGRAANLEDMARAGFYIYTNKKNGTI